MEKVYNSSWGFMHKRGLSLWTESEHARRGVAILSTSYSSVTEMVPWYEVHWSPRWMSVQITPLGETVLVVSVYAPSVKTERESIFERLLLHLQEYDEPMYVGGDFNNT